MAFDGHHDLLWPFDDISGDRVQAAIGRRRKQEEGDGQTLGVSGEADGALQVK